MMNQGVPWFLTHFESVKNDKSSPTDSRVARNFFGGGTTWPDQNVLRKLKIKKERNNDFYEIFLINLNFSG